MYEIEIPKFSVCVTNPCTGTWHPWNGDHTNNLGYLDNRFDAVPFKGVHALWHCYIHKCKPRRFQMPQVGILEQRMSLLFPQSTTKMVTKRHSKNMTMAIIVTPRKCIMILLFC